MEVRINGTSDLLEVEICGPLAFPFTSSAYGSLNSDIIAALRNHRPVALDLSAAELIDEESAKHLVDLRDRFEAAQTPLGFCSIPAPLQERLMLCGLPSSTFHPSVEEFTTNAIA